MHWILLQQEFGWKISIDQYYSYSTSQKYTYFWQNTISSYVYILCFSSGSATSQYEYFVENFCKPFGSMSQPHYVYQD